MRYIKSFSRNLKDQEMFDKSVSDTLSDKIFFNLSTGFCKKTGPGIILRLYCLLKCYLCTAFCQFLLYQCNFRKKEILLKCLKTHRL